MELDDIVNLLGDQWRSQACLAVGVVVKVVHDGRELLLGLFVEVRDGNASCQESIVRVLGGQVGGSLSGKGVKIRGLHSLVDANNNLE